MVKRRILFCGESSWLSTGFAIYNREILQGLHATGKYILAEMGSYGSENMPQAQKLPWKFYGVLPKTEQEKKMYESNQANAFGQYKIDAVVADFQPDVIFSCTDPWMTLHLQACKFRDNYKLVLMPTVDSAPQRKDWLSGLFDKADHLLTYSRYGKRVLNDAGLKVNSVPSPGVCLDKFKPLDKQTIRDKYQIKPSLLIIGTVMRNQKRKLFPELFEIYASLRKKYRMTKKNKEDGKVIRIYHSALLCHTSWPDNGWNIPELLERHGLTRHVIFTYKCEACKAVFHSWFIPCDQKGFGVCRICGEKQTHMPNTHSGVSREQLAEIYNLMDIYVQPAICEGWGLPIMEAKACGVPGLYQNYSAMEDHVQNGGGLPIKIGRFYTECETMAIRSLPDNTDFEKKLEMLCLDSKKRKRLAKEARKCAVKMHNWDLSVRKIEKLFDTMKLKDRDTSWDRQPKFKYLTEQRPPANYSNQDFIHWCYTNILGRVADEKGFNDWMNSLQKNEDRNSVEQFFRNEIKGHNIFEEIRWKNSLKLRNLSLEIEEVVSSYSNAIPGTVL